MAKNLTAADRKALIRLASTMAVGSDERKAVLSGLSKTAWLDTLNEEADGDEWREDAAREAFRRVVGGDMPEDSLREVLRSVPAGVGPGFLYARKLTSRPNPMWFVWGATDKSGAARLARALFKARIPRTKRGIDAQDVYGSVLYIGLNDGTLAKFTAPEGLTR